MASLVFRERRFNIREVSSIEFIYSTKRISLDRAVPLIAWHTARKGTPVDGHDRRQKARFNAVLESNIMKQPQIAGAPEPQTIPIDRRACQRR